MHALNVCYLEGLSATTVPELSLELLVCTLVLDPLLYRGLGLPPLAELLREWLAVLFTLIA